MSTRTPRPGSPLHAHSELIPVARANGITAVLAAPQGGLISGQSALIRLAGTTPDALTRQDARPRCTWSTRPASRALDIAAAVRGAGAEDVRGAAEGEEEEPGEGAATGSRNLLEEAKAYGAALDAAAAGKALAPEAGPRRSRRWPRWRAASCRVMHAGGRRGRHPRRRRVRRASAASS